MSQSLVKWPYRQKHLLGFRAGSVAGCQPSAFSQMMDLMTKTRDHLNSNKFKAEYFNQVKVKIKHFQSLSFIVIESVRREQLWNSSLHWLTSFHGKVKLSWLKLKISYLSP